MYQLLNLQRLRTTRGQFPSLPLPQQYCRNSFHSITLNEASQHASIEASQTSRSGKPAELPSRRTDGHKLPVHSCMAATRAQSGVIWADAIGSACAPWKLAHGNKLVLAVGNQQRRSPSSLVIARRHPNLQTREHHGTRHSRPRLFSDVTSEASRLPFTSRIPGRFSAGHE